MSTLTYNLAVEYGPTVAKVTTLNGVRRLGKNAKNVALFFAAPFIGLIYALAFPLIGLGLLAWMAAKAVMKNKKARTVALVIAAPIIALAFVAIGPIVGLGGLAWVGAKALV